MNKTSVFTLVDTVRWVTFPVKNWKKAPSVSDFANLIIWCNSNMTNMGAHEKKSNLAVWTLELVELVCFFKFYCKQQQQEQTITSMQSVCEQNDLNETFWLIMDFSLRLSSSPLTNIWELKQRRRQTQWERKKRNRFRFTKQQLCTCITLFCTFFFLPSLHDYDVKMPIFTFCGRREHKKRLFVPELRVSLSEFSSRKKFANSWRIERDRTRCSATSLISTLRWQPFAGTWTIFYVNKSDNVERYLLISLDAFLPYYKPSSTDWALMIELHREGQVGDLSYNWNIFLATETYPIGPLASE